MRSRGRDPPPECTKKYGFPLFCVSWLGVRQSRGQQDKEEPIPTDQGPGYVILGGGGGSGQTGIHNALAVARYDFHTNVLSESVYKFDTDEDSPYKIAVHPSNNDIVCSFLNGCRWFEVDVQDETVSIKPADTQLAQLEDAGQQRSLVFNTDGTLLAAGGDDGHLRVFEWPSLNIVFDQPDAHKSIKDLDFSLDGTLLASVGDTGPCRIWNLSTSAPAVSLSVDKGECFGFCRFSRDSLKPLLFMTVKQGEKGLITYWETNSWKNVGTQVFTKNPISAFNISSDGKLLAIGTSEGDISIIEVGRMHRHQNIRAAHMIFVTSMEFSRDSRALVSVSGDSSARVTQIEKQKHGVVNLRLLIFIIFLAILAFYLINKGLW